MTHNQFSREKSISINRVRNKMLELVGENVLNKPLMFNKVHESQQEYHNTYIGKDKEYHNTYIGKDKEGKRKRYEREPSQTPRDEKYKI